MKKRAIIVLVPCATTTIIIIKRGIVIEIILKNHKEQEFNRFTPKQKDINCHSWKNTKVFMKYNERLYLVCG